jgi:hypothetical protein
MRAKKCLAGLGLAVGLSLAGPAWAQNPLMVGGFSTPATNQTTTTTANSALAPFGSFNLVNFMPKFLGISNQGITPTNNLPSPTTPAAATAYLQQFGLSRPVRATIP